MKIQIIESKGDVFFWSKFGAKWNRVKDQKTIPSDSIMIILEGASITYKSLDKKGTDNITIRTPLALRLDGNEVRNFNFKPEFVPDSLDLEIDENIEEEATLESAWNRILMFGNRTAAIKKKDPEDSTKLSSTVDSAFALDLGKQSISIITPKKGSVIVGNNLPHPVKIYWKDLKSQKGKGYQVSIKKAGQLKQVVAMTKRRDFTHHFREYGTYTIEIKSKSQNPTEITTITSTIDIVTPYKETISEGYLKTIRTKNLDPKPESGAVGTSYNPIRGLALKSIFPTADFFFVEKELPGDIRFSWQPTSLTGSTKKYQVTLLDHQFKKIFSKTINQPHTSFKIREKGRYYWRIEGDDHLRKTSWRTAWRAFTINPPAQQILDSKSGTFYLEEGLSVLNQD